MTENTPSRPVDPPPLPAAGRPGDDAERLAGGNDAASRPGDEDDAFGLKPLPDDTNTEISAITPRCALRRKSLRPRQRRAFPPIPRPRSQCMKGARMGLAALRRPGKPYKQSRAGGGR